MGADGGGVLVTTFFLENTLKYSTLIKYNLHSRVRKIAKIHSFWDISDHPRKR